MAWVVAWATAQTPEPEPEPEPEPAPSSYEVVVYGEIRVEQARQAIITELEQMGFTADVIDRGDRVVYRHDSPWYGEVVLFDDGFMRVKRQAFRVEGRKMPWADRNSTLAWAGCFVWPWACVRLNGATYGQRKWLGTQSRTVGQIHAPVERWADRIADLETERKIVALPERLTALWEDGVPLDPNEAPLATFADRRAALLAFVASRTDTVWGDEVRAAVGSFIRGVVQAGDHPFTDAEKAAFVLRYPALAIVFDRPPEEP